MPPEGRRGQAAAGGPISELSSARSSDSSSRAHSPPVPHAFVLRIRVDVCSARGRVTSWQSNDDCRIGSIAVGLQLGVDGQSLAGVAAVAEQGAHGGQEGGTREEPRGARGWPDS